MRAAHKIQAEAAFVKIMRAAHKIQAEAAFVKREIKCLN